SQLSWASLSEISISLTRAEGFFLTNIFWICSASFKNLGWEYLSVGSLLSKSNDFAGEITIFITIGLKGKNNTDFWKFPLWAKRVVNNLIDYVGRNVATFLYRVPYPPGFQNQIA